jgi:hypothetical protein
VAGRAGRALITWEFPRRRRGPALQIPSPSETRRPVLDQIIFIVTLAILTGFGLNRGTGQDRQCLAVATKPDDLFGCEHRSGAAQPIHDVDLNFSTITTGDTAGDRIELGSSGAGGEGRSFPQPRELRQGFHRVGKKAKIDYRAGAYDDCDSVVGEFGIADGGRRKG